MRRRGNPNALGHHCSVEMLPHLRVWIAWCVLCGEVSLGYEREAEAWAVADRHEAANGYVRAGAR